MYLRKICITFILLVFLSVGCSFCNEIEDETSIPIEQEIAEVSSSAEKTPEINSRSAVVIDRATKKILYGKNEYDVRKMASTTKIMTAIVVIENSNLNDTVNVTKKASLTGGSTLGIHENDKITVHDLLYGLLLRSGNDTAVALAEHVGGSIEGFADKMNEKSNELGLKNTHFVTPHGLDNDNHYTTAYELAIITDYALNNKTFLNIVGTKNYTISINGMQKQISNTNELLGNLNGVYGVKTGFTNGANRCLVTSCKRDNLDIICVVLGADTKKFRTQDSIKLIEYVYKTYQVIDLEKIVNENFNKWKNENIKKIQINKCKEKSLDLKLQGFNFKLYPVKKENISGIDVKIDYKNLLDAPIEAGSEIGKMSIIINSNEVLNYKIVNTFKINKKNCTDFFLEILSNFFKYLTIKI